MNNWDCRRKPVHINRDAGYSKMESISPENRERARERMLNPNVVTGNFKLKELNEKMGVVMHPEKLTNWYPY